MAQQTRVMRVSIAPEWKLSNKDGRPFVALSAALPDGFEVIAGVRVEKVAFVSCTGWDEAAELLVACEVGKQYSFTGEFRRDEYKRRNGMEAVGLALTVADVEEVAGESPVAQAAPAQPAQIRSVG